MNNVISFIRKYKTTPISDLLPILHDYDKKIKTRSIHLALVSLFEHHYQNLNEKRLYELMRWVNKKFSELPSTSNVEMNLSKIRQIVKAKYGGDSTQYAKSQTHLVFDPEQKKKNIAEYNKQVFDRNSDCKPIKVSLIDKLLSYKDSEDYRKKLVYLLINSGARYHELFSGVWSADTENEQNIKISNIAKTRDKEREISKPLLDGNSTTFLSILGEIRNLNEESTLHSVNKFLKQEIGESSYFLRKCYANYAYYRLNDPTIAKTTYLSKILGHEINNESTATCYQGYYIEDS